MLSSKATSVIAFFWAGMTLASAQQYKLDVELVARNLSNPVDLTFIPGDTSGRRFILEQDGRILILEADNSINVLNPFLNIQDRVLGLQYPFDERGLIGFAFHPKYSENGKLYVRYTANRTKTENVCVELNGTIPKSPDGCPGQHSSLLSEFTVSSSNANLIDSKTEQILIEVENPTGRNIGGDLEFGPDGLLYAGFGDGGGYYGPSSDVDTTTPNGVTPQLYFFDFWPQNLTLPYGKVLRIDVDSKMGNLSYGIPKSNPWANNTKGYDPRIYAWGFRNPFRMSFDRNYYQQGVQAPSNGYFPFWISASSETLFDATDFVDAPGNYGWAVKQGSHCFSRQNPLVPSDAVICTDDADCRNVTVHGQKPMCGKNGRCTCNMTDAEGYMMRDPVIEYVNDNAGEKPVAQALVAAGLLAKPLGRASLGGYVYRGSAIPWLVGKFVNGDFAVNQLDGQLLIATDPGNGSIPWPLERSYVFDKASSTKAGFLKTIGEGADGELYAITGEFDAFMQIDGRVFKIIDGSTPSVTNDKPASSPVTSPSSPVASNSTGKTSAAGKHVVISLGLGVSLVLGFFGL